jgi:hypothetical protein
MKAPAATKGFEFLIASFSNQLIYISPIFLSFRTGDGSGENDEADNEVIVGQHERHDEYVVLPNEDTESNDQTHGEDIHLELQADEESDPNVNVDDQSKAQSNFSFFILIINYTVYININLYYALIVQIKKFN